MKSPPYGRGGWQFSGDELQARQREQQAAGVVGPCIVAAGVHDPTNIGMIFRIADALNCREVLLVDVPHADSKRIRQVSRSASEKCPHRFITGEAFTTLAAGFAPLVALEITSTAADLYQTVLPRDLTLVVGDERYGIPEPVLALCTGAVYIPMFGINSSMNVATSLGIALYEWYRQHWTL